MKILLKTLNNNIITVDLTREELIYGAVAVFSNQTEEKFALHPLTNERIPIIYSDKNRFIIPAHIEEDYIYAHKNNLKIKQVVAPYFYGKGEEKVKDNVKTQFRHSIIAVIKHNIDDKYLCVDCKNRECKSFVLGGIEENENNVEAALREIREETGYIDVSINKVSDISVYNHFYAGYKGVNRYAILDIVFGKLLSEKREKMSEEESNKHIVKWINKNELESFINIDNNLYVLEELFNGSKAYQEEEGKMINSFGLDRLDVLEARKIMKKKLGELNDKCM